VTSQLHLETLEEEATHVTDEARMVLPGVQAILGFQLMAVFNQRFEQLAGDKQLLHLAAFLLTALAMGLLMAPAAYHRIAERGCVSRRFVAMGSALLCASLVPLLIGVSFDAYIVAGMILPTTGYPLVVGLAVLLLLSVLWFGLPAMALLHRRAGTLQRKV
jgi:hypothetical protein